MGKVVETKKKKKKGRPSLLDLQKRNIREQQLQQQQLLQHFNQKHQQQQRKKNSHKNNTNYTSAPPNQSSLRRSTRRHHHPDDDQDVQLELEDDGNDAVSEAKRRDKKLKLVVKLPSNSAADDSGSGADESKKRKINAIGDGSGPAHPRKGDKSVPALKPSSSTLQGGVQSDSGPSTPLPDLKLLLFVLERLQKKDTYGVFSEPVDPEELPDYHEVIDDPMDFGTVKKKLTSGAYTSLEQFEDDIFLICSNAMQYNAPDTIYFRQARSIHELAKKNFENLRQDSDDDNEPEPKVVRRGRPPTKNLKKPLGRSPLERTGSEFSDATLATGAENAILSNYDMRKGPHLLDGSRNNDVYTNWLPDNKFERNDDITGSMMRGNSKFGKKQFVFDENRRNTYLQHHPSASGLESSVFTTFDRERKQLMPVGLHSDGYARSLARFAASLGPVAWRIAAQKIERSLPAGVKFGPGWVGENDVAPRRQPIIDLSSLSLPFPILGSSASAATSCCIESSGDKLAEKPSGHNPSEKHALSIRSALDGHPNSSLPLSAATSSSPLVAHKSPKLTGKADIAEGSNCLIGTNMMNRNLGEIRPRPPFQIHQTRVMQPGINGLNGSNPPQIGKQVGVTRSGNFQSSQMLDQVSGSNTNLIHPAASNSLNPEKTKLSGDPGTIKSSSSSSNSVKESLPAQASGVVHPRPSRQGSSSQLKAFSGFTSQQKLDSAPPDLNVRFQSPGSPSSSRADATQPDLVLQL